MFNDVPTSSHAFGGSQRISRNWWATISRSVAYVSPANDPIDSVSPLRLLR